MSSGDRLFIQLYGRKYLVGKLESSFRRVKIDASSSFIAFFNVICPVFCLLDVPAFPVVLVTEVLGIYTAKKRFPFPSSMAFSVIGDALHFYRHRFAIFNESNYANLITQR